MPVVDPFGCVNHCGMIEVEVRQYDVPLVPRLVTERLDLTNRGELLAKVGREQSLGGM